MDPDAVEAIERRRCLDCGRWPTAPGKWRCADCQRTVDQRAAAARAVLEANRRAESAAVHDER